MSRWVVIEKNILIFGSNWRKEIPVFNAETRQWTSILVKGKHPSPKLNFFVTAAGSVVFLIDESKTERITQILVFDTVNQIWNERNILSNDAPTTRTGPSITRLSPYGTKFILFGGHTSTKYHNDLWILDSGLMTWIPVKGGGTAPSPRSHHCALLVGRISLCDYSIEGNRIYVFGGKNNTTEHMSDLHYLDTESYTWHSVKTEGPVTGRHSHSMASLGPRIFIFGGSRAHTNSSSHVLNLRMYRAVDFAYSVVNNTWTEWNGLPEMGSACFVYHRRSNANDDTLPVSEELVVCPEPQVAKAKNFLFFPIAEFFPVVQIAPPKIISDISQLCCNHKFSDRTLSIDGETVPLHTPLLFTRWNNGRKQLTQTGTISLPLELLKQVLKVVYGLATVQEEDTALSKLKELADETLHGKTLFTQDLNFLLSDKSTCDSTFLVQNCQVRFHKCIVAQRSEYMRALMELNQLSLDNSNSNTPSAQIELKEFSASVLEELLRFLYTDELGGNADTIIELFTASKLMMLDRLSGLCEDWLVRSLDKDNVVALLQVAMQTQSIGLHTQCITFIQQNYREVIRASKFAELPSETVEEIQLYCVGLY